MLAKFRLDLTSGLLDSDDLDEIYVFIRKKRRLLRIKILSSACYLEIILLFSLQNYLRAAETHPQSKGEAIKSRINLGVSNFF